MRKKTFSLLCFLALFFGINQEALAQDGVGKFLKDTVKDVAFDPTTYGPFGASWLGKKLDWDSSQILFANGFVEDNSDFTINGLPHDKPIGYAAGNRKIIKLSLSVLQLSVINNITVSIPERILIRSHPNHKKLIKSVGWIEKIAVAAYFGYKYSHKNFGQWQTNNRMARELGLK